MELEHMEPEPSIPPTSPAVQPGPLPGPSKPFQPDPLPGPPKPFQPDSSSLLPMPSIPFEPIAGSSTPPKSRKTIPKRRHFASQTKSLMKEGRKCFI